MKFELGQIIVTSGGIITDGGLICKVTKVTPCRIKVRVLDMYFPVHKKLGQNDYQVDPASQEYQREIQIGRELEFWTVHETRKFQQYGMAYNWHCRTILEYGHPEATKIIEKYSAKNIRKECTDGANGLDQLEVWKKYLEYRGVNWYRVFQSETGFYCDPSGLTGGDIERIKKYFTQISAFHGGVRLGYSDLKNAAIVGLFDWPKT